MSIGSLVRGGQVTVHGWRMSFQLLKVIMSIFLGVIIFSASGNIWHYSKNNTYERDLAWAYVKAHTIYVLSDDDARINWPYEGAFEGTMDLATVRTHPAFSGGKELFVDAAWRGAIWGGVVALLMVFITIFAFWRRGRNVVEKQHIKGSLLVKPKVLKKIIAEKQNQLNKENKEKNGSTSKVNDGGKYNILGIPWVGNEENHHTLIVGTTGSGKTVTISDLLDQIEANGDKAIVFDKLGSFIPHFYQADRDIILNPFDERSAEWCIFSEAEEATDFKSMAAALIPDFKDNADPFWTSSARLLFSSGASSMWKSKDYNLPKLIDLLLKTSLKELAEKMKDTEAQSIIDVDNPKTSLSVRSVLTSHVEPLNLLRPVRKPFTIRKWVQDDQKGFLFLSSHARTHEVRRAQIATQIELALTALQSMEKDPDRKIWIIIDELPALHKIPSLIPGLREIRQFGGAIVLGTQVFSEIKDLYGREAAQSISGNCNTRISLATPDKETAAWMSDNFGRAVTQRMNEGFSFGANTIRDGVSHTQREDLQPIVLPSDLMNLPKLVGYMKMPFDLPVTKIKIKPVDRPSITKAFIMHRDAPDEVIEHEDGPTPAGPVSEGSLTDNDAIYVSADDLNDDDDWGRTQPSTKAPVADGGPDLEKDINVSKSKKAKKEAIANEQDGGRHEEKSYSPFPTGQKAGASNASQRDHDADNDPLLTWVDPENNSSSTPPLTSDETDEGKASLKPAEEQNSRRLNLDNIICIEVDTEDQVERAADIWFKLDDLTCTDTLIITVLPFMQEDINECIRETLIIEGDLSGDTLEYMKLEDCGLTQDQKTKIASYRDEEAVIFGVNSPKRGLKADTVYRITGRDERSVLLCDENGKDFSFDPSGAGQTRNDIAARLKVYHQSDFEIMEGEVIRWTRGDEALGLETSTTATIDQVGDDNIIITTHDQRSLVLDIDDPQLRHCDYAYASMLSAVSNNKADKIIALIPSDPARSSDAKALYDKTCSKEAIIITDNIEDLKVALSDAPAKKESKKIEALKAAPKKKTVKEKTKRSAKKQQVKKKTAEQVDEKPVIEEQLTEEAGVEQPANEEPIAETPTDKDSAKVLVVHTPLEPAEQEHADKVAKKDRKDRLGMMRRSPHRRGHNAQKPLPEDNSPKAKKKIKLGSDI